MPNRPYPYLPVGRTILYVPEDNKFMLKAAQNRLSLISKYPDMICTSAVIVKNGEIVGRGLNKPVHKSFCPRTVFDSPSGQDYDLCPHYCHSDNHAETAAVRDAQGKGRDTADADLYLYGHWWLCKSCWDKIIEARIKDVYLVQDADEKFYQESSGKGEPRQALEIFVEDGQPGHELKLRFKKVLISFVDSPAQADFIFRPTSKLGDKQFTIALSEALQPYYGR